MPSPIKLEFVRESLHFSAGHFTIFAANKRENMHGHNFRIQAEVGCPIDENGLCFDYSILKRLLQSFCDELDEKFLLPSLSPHLKLNYREQYVFAEFDDEELRFLERDVLVLPVRNITVEELANWFADRLNADAVFASLPIQEMAIRVASGSGQWAVVQRSRT